MIHETFEINLIKINLVTDEGNSQSEIDTEQTMKLE